MNLFPFFFNEIDPPACSVASNYIQPVEWQMSPRHRLTGAPMGNARRHNRLTIMGTEKLGTRGLKLTRLIPARPHCCQTRDCGASRGPRTYCSGCSRKALKPPPPRSLLDFPFPTDFPRPEKPASQSLRAGSLGGHHSPWM